MARPVGTTKPPEDKYITTSLRFPPDLWKRLEETIPARKRSRFIHELVERELDRLDKKAGKKAEPPTPQRLKRKRYSEEEWAAAVAYAQEHWDGKSSPDDEVWDEMRPIGDEVVD